VYTTRSRPCHCVRASITVYHIQRNHIPVSSQSRFTSECTSFPFSTCIYRHLAYVCCVLLPSALSLRMHEYPPLLPCYSLPMVPHAQRGLDRPSHDNICRLSKYLGRYAFHRAKPCHVGMQWTAGSLLTMDRHNTLQIQ
jgi:hypothetical protein